MLSFLVFDTLRCAQFFPASHVAYPFCSPASCSFGFSKKLNIFFLNCVLLPCFLLFLHRFLLVLSGLSANRLVLFCFGFVWFAFVFVCWLVG